ncbi:MAG: calcium-binding protein, partial [Planctomycetaceae bacterium]
MKLSWAQAFENWTRKHKHQRRRTPALSSIQNLEQRTLLTVSTLFANNELTVVVDEGNDSISLGTSPANPSLIELTVNTVVDTSLPPIAAADVGSVVIIGSDGANSIDLSGITTAAFTFTDPVSGNPLQILVDAGNGDDTLIASSGFNDTLQGGHGNDILGPSPAASATAVTTFDGGDGADIINGSFADDILIGGDGDDLITGNAGNDDISGGNGEDRIDGSSGNDTISAGQGADIVTGGTGDDSISGDDGNDSLLGEDGNDTLRGGIRDDTLDGGFGDDSLAGEGGSDSLSG